MGSHVELLRDVLEAMEQESVNRDGDDPHGVYEANCRRCFMGWGEHSIGCRVKEAIRLADAQVPMGSPFKFWGHGTDEGGFYLLGTSGEPPLHSTVKLYVGKSGAEVVKLAIDQAYPQPDVKTDLIEALRGLMSGKTSWAVACERAEAVLAKAVKP